MMVSRLAAFLIAMACGVTAHAAASTAAPLKVLYVAQQSIGGDALDPARINSILVANVLENIMEPMLQYDYLARPLKLVPNTLASMPEISEGGRVYLCRLKRGVLFSPDPAFKGKPRELTLPITPTAFDGCSIPKINRASFFWSTAKLPARTNCARPRWTARASTTTHRSQAYRCRIATRCVSRSTSRM